MVYIVTTALHRVKVDVATVTVE